MSTVLMRTLLLELFIRLSLKCLPILWWEFCSPTIQNFHKYPLVAEKYLEICTVVLPV